ncbi:YIM1 [Candida oxycetoniae]|uniref:YIM1 n=1 Tax=Candida oxycetoniae TaxID=497107 RepID=A0AAI9SSR5_9ASCO|nr:YIM1 [Candida oxycetoniae]KAI3402368.1 YIM1 [Candida oxycetoniae]
MTSFKSDTITYKAYAYQNGNYPIEIVDETIKLVKGPGPSDEFVAPPGKILLKINYAALNPVDYKLYHMKPSFLRFYNNKQGFGRDFSGEVLSIGANTSTQVKVGDFVEGIYTPVLDKGSCAQYLLLDPKVSPITTKPSNIDLVQASAWPLVLGTAMQLSKGLQYKDSKVLVLGAGTSVGRYVVQLARIGGAREVVTTNSARAESLIRELGATEQIDYRKHPNFLNPVLESVKTSGEFNYIIDCWGGAQLFPEIDNILVKGGEYRTIVGDTPGHGLGAVFGTIKSALRTIVSKLGLLDYLYQFAFLKNTDNWIDNARDLIEEGKVKIFVDHIYPFEQLKEAVERLVSGKAEGKVILEVAKPEN